MGNETILRIDHVGAPLVTYFDLRHQIPDELEIDLGNADSAVGKGTSKRQGHVRFGFAAKIDRPVVDLVRHRVDELGIRGKIGIAADQVRRNPRNTQPLAPAGVELHEFSDGGHLAEQTQSIELPLLQRARGQRHLGGPAEMTLDILDEIADPASRRVGLLALDANKRSCVIAIVEPDVEQAVGQQRQADHGHEQRDILAKEAAPYDHGSSRRGCREPSR
jgi:hypothetical protein